MTIDGTTQTAFTGDTRNGVEVIINWNANDGGFTLGTTSTVITLKGLGFYNNLASIRAITVTVSNMTVTIDGNEFYRNYGGSIRVNNTTGSIFTITNNTFTEVGYRPVTLVANNAGRPISMFGGAPNGQISNNTFINNSVDAISLSGTTVAGNTTTIQNNTFTNSCKSFATAALLISSNDSANQSATYVITGNTITQNSSTATCDGIRITGTTSKATISQNSISSNSGIGIDIRSTTGVTVNDSGDTDSGANDLMNYPVITKVVKNGTNLIVTANLDFKASEAPYTIELFDNDAIDSTGYGEGQYFIGSVSTSSIGNGVTLTIPITGTTPTTAARITSTATNTSGSTSEFSAAPTDTTLYSASFLTGVSISNSISSITDGKSRITGTASTGQYTVSIVEYSVNNNSFGTCLATDSYFEEANEEFYCDFDPKSNQPKDSKGNLIDGYTVKVRAKNTNDVWTENALYFTPFNLNEPADNTITTLSTPAFDFSVIKQRDILKSTLSKYQIQVRKGGSDSTAPWEVLIDDIPIDGTLDITGTNSFENDKLRAVYTDDSSRIKVYSKVKTLAGSTQWKAAAVDKSGHTQDSSTRSLKVNTKTSVTTSNFPLAILNISGLGNPDISTTNLSAIKDTYYLNSPNPIFYGIAFTNAKITLNLTEQDCVADCAKTYSTIANQDSRFGINIPKDDLKYGKKYKANMSVSYIQDYNELPEFTLSTSGSAAKPKTAPTPQLNPTPTPTPTPTPQPIGKQQETSRKNCFLFWCF